MATNVVVAVYDPPASGLPYLAVALVSNEIVGTLAAETAAEALRLIVRFGHEWDKLDFHVASDKPQPPTF
jgi:hypothetical protein